MQEEFDEMLMFGETSVKVDPIMMFREAAEETLGKLIADGVIEMSEFPGLSRLIASSDEENIKLAVKIMQAYVKKFSNTLGV